jgi:phage terminase large subunit-like protein
MAKQLADDDGMKMMEFRQGYKSMNEPSKEFEKLVIQRRLAHLGNPVLRWMASNVQVAEDPAGNIKPTKAQKDSPRKIDGIVGLVMAVGLSMTVKAEEQPFKYGMTFI